MVSFGKQGHCFFGEHSLLYKSQMIQDRRLPPFPLLNSSPWTDVPGLCHPPCSAPASATLHSSPSFFWNPSYAIPDHSLHPGNPEPSGAWQKHGENGAKEQTLMQPMGKLVHVAHTSLQHRATELCCSTRNSKGHRQKGLVSKIGFYFKNSLSTAEIISSFFFSARVGIFILSYLWFCISDLSFCHCIFSSKTASFTIWSHSLLLLFFSFFPFFYSSGLPRHLCLLYLGAFCKSTVMDQPPTAQLLASTCYEGINHQQNHLPDKWDCIAPIRTFFGGQLSRPQEKSVQPQNVLCM